MFFSIHFIAPVENGFGDGLEVDRAAHSAMAH
jgi:hypothetical protein